MKKNTILFFAISFWLITSVGTSMAFASRWVLPPTNLTLKFVSATSATVSWTASTSNNINYYIVYRNGTQGVSVPGNTLSYTDTGLTASRWYIYTVRAENSLGQLSDPSNLLFVPTSSSNSNYAINGTCGGASGVETLNAPTINLCASGSASTVTENGTTTWNWNCDGTNGASNAACSAPVQPPAVNGACGSANGRGITSVPSTNFCSSGVATIVSGSGPWAWECNGTNGGSDASCSAPLIVNGVCGQANGTVTSTAPTSNLCTAGTASSVAATGPSYAPWNWSCAGPNGGTSVNCNAPSLPAFYVANNGSDSNPGTLAAPFATLGMAQSAMQASSTIKITYVRSGSYTLPTIAKCDGTNSCGLLLNSSDNGETWSYYPPDGVDSANLTGGSTGPGNGLFYDIYFGNITSLTINGLSVHNFQFAGIASLGGTKNLTVENNLIFNGYIATGTDAAGFFCYGCANTTISHNVVHDIASFGINLNNVNGNISNLLVTGNVLYNTCTGIADCGAIYAQDTSATATNIQWTNNFIRDGNTFATLGSEYGSALYADDCLSNVTASGNVVSGRNGSNTMMIHGGNNVHYLGNLTDLSTYQQNIALFQTSQGSGCSSALMIGNQYENNIIISAGGGGGYNRSGTPLNSPAITNNAYYNFGGSTVNFGGAYTDELPVTENPQLCSWIYSIASASPVLGATAYFPGLTGGWGPPGYVIPQTGTPPSSPETCSTN